MAIPPAFADIPKAANDLLNKDFYHTAATNFEVKSKAPNGVNFNVKGKSSHEGKTSGSIEGKYADLANGTFHFSISRYFNGHSRTTVVVRPFKRPPTHRTPTRAKNASNPFDSAQKKSQRDESTVTGSASGPNEEAVPESSPSSSTPTPTSTNPIASTPPPPQEHTATPTKSKHEAKRTKERRKATDSSTPSALSGLTLTQSWTTQNSLDTKVELDNQITKGLKAEVLTSFLPASQQTNARMNLHFKQPNFHTRAFVNLLKGPTATIDATLGHEGFLVGAEAGYDVQKAAITGYAAAVGYSVPQYSAAITATSNLSVFSACYYHKVNPLVEAGAKAVWDSKTSSTVGLEVGGKYRLDPSSFAKVKMNDRGIASAAYSCLIRPGVTLGFGASFDTQAFDKSAPKVGANFVFEG
ncbi:hypothetical protein MMC25_002040 [Agyrium rufum]|nr:hypothetical protein [Agyrium rufum]